MTKFWLGDENVCRKVFTTKRFSLFMHFQIFENRYTGISGENSDDEGEEEEIHFDLTQQVEAHDEESDGSDDDDGDVVIVRKKKLKVIEDSESDDESDKNIAGITCK